MSPLPGSEVKGEGYNGSCTTIDILKGVWDEYLVKSVFRAPVPAYCLAQALALSAHAERLNEKKCGFFLYLLSITGELCVLK